MLSFFFQKLHIDHISLPCQMKLVRLCPNVPFCGRWRDDERSVEIFACLSSLSRTSPFSHLCILTMHNSTVSVIWQMVCSFHHRLLSVMNNDFDNNNDEDVIDPIRDMNACACLGLGFRLTQTSCLPLCLCHWLLTSTAHRFAPHSALAKLEA